MIVRDVRLKQADGGYHLVSAPTSALENHVKRTHLLGDIVVRGTRDLDVRSPAYDLTCELVWDPSSAPANIGLEVCRAEGGGRRVAAGAFLRGPFAYLNRRPTINPTGGETQTPIDPAAGRLTIRILVDLTSVEMFVGDGPVVHSHRVFPLKGDSGIRLYAHEGAATFRNLTIHEIKATQ